MRAIVEGRGTNGEVLKHARMERPFRVLASDAAQDAPATGEPTKTEWMKLADDAKSAADGERRGSRRSAPRRGGRVRRRTWSAGRAWRAWRAWRTRQRRRTGHPGAKGDPGEPGRTRRAGRGLLDSGRPRAHRGGDRGRGTGCRRSDGQPSHGRGRRQDGPRRRRIRSARAGADGVRRIDAGRRADPRSAQADRER